MTCSHKIFRASPRLCLFTSNFDLFIGGPVTFLISQSYLEQPIHYCFDFVCFCRPLHVVLSLLLGLEEVTRLRLVNMRFSILLLETLLPKM